MVPCENWLFKLKEIPDLADKEDWNHKIRGTYISCSFYCYEFL